MNQREWKIIGIVYGIVFVISIFIPYLLVMLDISFMAGVFTEEIVIAQIILYIVSFALSVFIVNFYLKKEAERNKIVISKGDDKGRKEKELEQSEVIYCIRCGYDMRERKECPLCGWIK